MSVESLTRRFNTHLGVERDGRDHTLCDEKNGINNQIQKGEVFILLHCHPIVVQHLDYGGAYGHAHTLDRQNSKHGFPEPRTVMRYGGGLRVVEHYAYCNKQTHSQQKQENLCSFVRFSVTHSASTVHFSLYNTDTTRGSYVTLYMNPDTMDFKQSMFIPSTTSAIGKLCPNQRRVPQLVSVLF
jgi:hypothetical protein